MCLINCNDFLAQSCRHQRILDAIYGWHIGHSLRTQQLPALAVTASAFCTNKFIVDATHQEKVCPRCDIGHLNSLHLLQLHFWCMCILLADSWITYLEHFWLGRRQWSIWFGRQQKLFVNTCMVQDSPSKSLLLTQKQPHTFWLF